MAVGEQDKRAEKGWHALPTIRKGGFQKTEEDGVAKDGCENKTVGRWRRGGAEARGIPKYLICAGRQEGCLRS